MIKDIKKIKKLLGFGLLKKPTIEEIKMVI